MNGGELMVLLIVAIAVFGGIVKSVYKSDASENAAVRDSATDAENRQLREELRAMKDRLAVLERLATENNDSGARLDREIERLRDRP